MRGILIFVVILLLSVAFCGIVPFVIMPGQGIGMGLPVVTVPGDFTRRETVTFTGELPNGHYRDYGLDFVERLRSRFQTVDVRDLYDLDRDASGLSRGIRRRDLAFVCRP